MKKEILLVGAGRWGKTILKNFPQASLDLGGIVTSQEASLFPYKTFPNLPAALAAQKWAGVILASPPALHVSQLFECAKYDLPVWVEKPLALSLLEAESLKALKIPVFVDHVQLFHLGFEWLKKNIPAQDILAIRSAGGNQGPHRSGYSALWDYGSHDLSMIFSLLQDPVLSRSALETKNENGSSFHCTLRFPHATADFFSSNCSPEKTRFFEVETRSHIYRLDDIPEAKLMATKKNGDSQEIFFGSLKPLARALEIFAAGLEGKFDERWGLELGIKVVQELCALEAQTKAGDN